MLRPNANLKNGRNVAANTSCQSPLITQDNKLFINELIHNMGILPLSPPFEIHPYKEDFPLQNFEKYIIGTMPPISYALDDPRIVEAGIESLFQPFGANYCSRPLFPFYHANRGSLWHYLLNGVEREQLRIVLNQENGRQMAKEWLMRFLENEQINYADIIDFAQRKLKWDRKVNNYVYNASDDSLYNICPNIELIYHILKNPNAKFLIFNTGSTFGNGGINFHNQVKVKSFDLFVRTCLSMGFEVEIMINGRYVNVLNAGLINNKLIFELKISLGTAEPFVTHGDRGERFEEIRVVVITGPSPSDAALRGIRRNNIYNSWQEIGHEGGNTEGDFIRSIYQSCRNNNWELLHQLNQ